MDLIKHFIQTMIFNLLKSCLELSRSFSASEREKIIKAFEEVSDCNDLHLLIPHIEILCKDSQLQPLMEEILMFLSNEDLDEATSFLRVNLLITSITNRIIGKTHEKIYKYEQYICLPLLFIYMHTDCDRIRTFIGASYFYFNELLESEFFTCLIVFHEVREILSYIHTKYTSEFKIK